MTRKKNAKRDEIYESVKLERRIVDRVRRHVKKSKQTISGFFTLAAQKELKPKSKQPFDKDAAYFGCVEPNE